MLVHVQALLAFARAALVMPRDENGSVVEKVILTAVFAGLAIAVGIIIIQKVKTTANNIDLTPPSSN